MKALACCLCAIVSWTTAPAYLGVDVALFMAYKLLRRDITYWAPVYGISGLATTFTTRFAVKLLVDFTANIHMRHFHEIGGVCWAITLLSTPIVCFYRYLSYVESDAGKALELSLVLNAEEVYGVIGSLVVLEITAFAFFFKYINQQYVNTFYSTKSGNEFVMDFFQKHDDDEYKLLVFTNNRHKWKKIEDDVIKWVNGKISEWNEEQPEWWDAQAKASIPNWVVTDPENLRSIRSPNVISQRRKSSIFTSTLSSLSSQNYDQKAEKAKTQRRKTLANNARLHSNEMD